MNSDIAMSEKFVRIMKENGWVCKKYIEDDIDRYISFLSSEYNGKDFLNKRFFQWQNESNPAGKVNMWYAEADNIMVGAYSIIPVRMMINGKETLGSQSLNTLTHKDYRGKKIFVTLAEITYRYAFNNNNINLIYGFPNQNSTHGFINNLNFDIIGPVPFMFKIIKPGSILKLKLKYLPADFINFFGRMIYRRRYRRIYTSFSIKKIELFDERFDILWESVKGLFKNIVIRNKRYLNWHYFENPVREYEVYAAVDHADRIIGYVVSKIDSSKGIDIGLIGDIITENGDMEIAEALLHQAEDYFIKKNAVMFGLYLLESSPYFNVLKNNYYIKCPKFLEPMPLNLIIRSMTNDRISTTKEDWHLTLSDCDTF